MTSKPAQRTGARVLVIDDDEIVLQAIRDLLTAAGYSVSCLVSPIGATQVIMSQHIEAVVVDLNMPVMRGDRFVSLLRSWDKIRDLPTVLISGASSATLEEAVRQLPGVGMVTKDTMQRTLPEILERMLARGRGRLSRPSTGTQRK